MKELESPKSQRATVGVSSSPSPAGAELGEAPSASPATEPDAEEPAPTLPLAPPPKRLPPRPDPSPPRELESTFPVSILLLALGSRGALRRTLASFRSLWMTIGLLPWR